MQTTLRKVGDSVMMTVRPGLLEALHLRAGAAVSVDVEDGRLIVQPCRPKYTVEELLVGYDPNIPRTEEDREWLESPAGWKRIDLKRKANLPLHLVHK